VLILRIVAFLAVVAIGISLVAALLTGDHRWYRFSWQIFKYGLIFALIVLGLLVLERVVLVAL
jgi:hypothetical protein